MRCLLRVQAPDYAEPLLGWRVWRVARQGRELRLVSALHDEMWAPHDELDASCHRQDDPLRARGEPPPPLHSAPARGCGCGIHATRAPAEAARYLLGRDDAPVVHRVIGQVALWGTVVEGSAGWRAQRGYPARLWIPIRRADSQPVAAEEVAAALVSYGVPVELLREHRPSDVGLALAQS